MSEDVFDTKNKVIKGEGRAENGSTSSFIWRLAE